MAKGGLRPNAGRKKANHTIQAEALRAYWVAEYIKRKSEIVKATLDKAVTGDVPAIREANERAMGKVKETTELVGKDGKDLFPVPILTNMNVSTHDRDKENKPAQ
jgi:hypothetical protein